jgi:3-methylfumaryl-CoA hydratase
VERVLHDEMAPGRAAALIATLGLDRPAPRAGEALAPGWHWLHFHEVVEAGRLGRDGHPAPGVLLPDTGLPRRMWAGGELAASAPLPLGRPATRRTTIGAPARKTGRSGPLAFVSAEHRVEGAAGPALVERQDLVYRADPDPAAPPPEPVPAPTDEAARRDWRLGPTALFRYSALTFNGHRIHYDADYARGVEGYAGLVVHAPLLATLMLEIAREARPERFAPHFEGRFAFRAVAPVFADEPFAACARPDDGGLALWVRAGDGRLVMRGRLTPGA